MTVLENLKKIVTENGMQRVDATMVVASNQGKSGIYVVQIGSFLVPQEYDEIVREPSSNKYWLKKDERWSLVKIEGTTLTGLLSGVTSFRHLKERDDYPTGYIEIETKDDVRLYERDRSRFVIDIVGLSQIENMSFTTYWRGSPSTDEPKHVYYICAGGKWGCLLYTSPSPRDA